MSADYLIVNVKKKCSLWISCKHATDELLGINRYEEGPAPLNVEEFKKSYMEIYEDSDYNENARLNSILYFCSNYDVVLVSDLDFPDEYYGFTELDLNADGIIEWKAWGTPAWGREDV